MSATLKSTKNSRTFYKKLVKLYSLFLVNFPSVRYRLSKISRCKQASLQNGSATCMVALATPWWSDSKPIKSLQELMNPTHFIVKADRMSHFARDQSIWNQWFYGITRVPSQLVAEELIGVTPDSDKGVQSEPKENWSDNCNEKSAGYAPINNCGGKHDECYDFSSEKRCHRERKRALQQNKKKHWWHVLKYILVIGCIITYYHFLYNLDSGSMRPQGIIKSPFSALRTYADTGSYSSQGDSPQEIISVAYPYVPKKSYGEPVYSEILIDHTFDSWGNPSLKHFKLPKNVTFNKVVLTLNTSVSGVQFDRLAHLYVGGAEIWRTSTIEPGGRKVFSSFKKDVSQYVTLFEDGSPILFQLDNLIVDGLDGKFHVKLQADFYSSASFHQIEDASSDPTEEILLDHEYPKMYQYFDIRKAADHVYPLNAKKCHKKLPIEYVPAQKFSVSLPQVPKNTTRLKLAVFASGNGNEEFWYSNVLDKYKHSFEEDGTEFLGHGPLRYVSVWVDGQKIASQSPQPFLFTGGYSPALWSPVVGINAFDLPSIDLDITPILPLLWESGNHNLKIQVDNGVDDFQGEGSGIGNDWIISANLLAYENSNVKNALGSSFVASESQKGQAFGVSIPYSKSLQQISSGRYSVDLSSLLLLELKNGELLNTSVLVLTIADQSNVQSYSESGLLGKIVHHGESIKTFSLLDNDDQIEFHATEVKTEFPLVLNYKEKMSKDGFVLNYDIALAKRIELNIDDKTVMIEKNAQNGTSHYLIGNKGNYGTANLTTRFKSTVNGPTKDFTYKRRVDAENGTIVRDEVETRS